MATDSMLSINGENLSLYIDKEAINRRINQLADQIESDYHGKKVTFLCVLKGAFVFASDLLRAYKGDCEISFIKLSSYEGTTSTGKVISFADMRESMTGKDVLIIEDIVDTGITMNYLVNELMAEKPVSIRIATCFDKPSRRRCEVKPDYVGFEIEDKFIVGYGLDYDGLYRNFPDVYTK